MAVTIRRETRDRGGDLLEGWAVFDGDDYAAAFYGPDAQVDAQAHAARMERRVLCTSDS